MTGPPIWIFWAIGILLLNAIVLYIYIRHLSSLYPGLYFLSDPKDKAQLKDKHRIWLDRISYFMLIVIAACMLLAVYQYGL